MADHACPYARVGVARWILRFRPGHRVRALPPALSPSRVRAVKRARHQTSATPPGVVPVTVAIPVGAIPRPSEPARGRRERAAAAFMGLRVCTARVCDAGGRYLPAPRPHLGPTPPRWAAVRGRVKEHRQELRFNLVRVTPPAARDPLISGATGTRAAPRPLGRSTRGVRAGRFPGADHADLFRARSSAQPTKPARRNRLTRPTRPIAPTIRGPRIGADRSKRPRAGS